MKRVKAGCILQTLIFVQKPELELNKEQSLIANRQEIENYKATLEKNRTRYVILDTNEQEDGSIIIHVKKQLNAETNSDEYFN